MSNFLDLALAAADSAGRKVLSIWKTAFTVEAKGDGSPCTEADRSAHEIILRALSDSKLPVVSEEGGDLQLTVNDYWLVDPLDGTKEFISNHQEFTINIARVVSGVPVLGVIVAPALGETYVGVAGVGAWRIDRAGTHELSVVERAPECRVAVSRFHDHAYTELFLARNLITHRIAIGSALKYARLAAASVDVFPRFVGCSEWDTAAGQAVLEAVGGSVLDCSTGRRLMYGKPKRRNPGLFSFRAPYRLEEFMLPCGGTD